MNARSEYSVCRCVTAIERRSVRAFDRLFANVWIRKSYHVIGGALVAVSIPLLGNARFAWLCVAGLTAFAMTAKRVSTVLLGLLLVDVLSGSNLTTLGAAVVFVVGDGLSALAGTAFGTTKLPWHGEKSVVGSLAFFGGAWVSLAWRLHAAFPENTGRTVVVALVVSVVGCLAETQPLPLVRDVRDGKPDDNLAIVLSAGAALHALLRIAAIGAVP
jgi:dolichol kinase